MQGFSYQHPVSNDGVRVFSKITGILSGKLLCECPRSRGFVREESTAAWCVMQGLIHISELAWSRVSNPETVVQPGSLVKCKVINVDREKGKIGLSLKVCSARAMSVQPTSICFDSQDPALCTCVIWPSILTCTPESWADRL